MGPRARPFSGAQYYPRNTKPQHVLSAPVAPSLIAPPIMTTARGNGSAGACSYTPRRPQGEVGCARQRMVKDRAWSGHIDDDSRALSGRPCGCGRWVGVYIPGVLIFAFVTTVGAICADCCHYLIRDSFWGGGSEICAGRFSHNDCAVTIGRESWSASSCLPSRYMRNTLVK